MWSNMNLFTVMVKIDELPCCISCATSKLFLHCTILCWVAVQFYWTILLQEFFRITAKCEAIELRWCPLNYFHFHSWFQYKLFFTCRKLCQITVVLSTRDLFTLMLTFAEHLYCIGWFKWKRFLFCTKLWRVTVNCEVI